MSLCENIQKVTANIARGTGSRSLEQWMILVTMKKTYKNTLGAIVSVAEAINSQLIQ